MTILENHHIFCNRKFQHLVAKDNEDYIKDTKMLYNTLKFHVIVYNQALFFISANVSGIFLFILFFSCRALNKFICLADGRTEEIG